MNVFDINTSIFIEQKRYKSNEKIVLNKKDMKTEVLISKDEILKKKYDGNLLNGFPIDLRKLQKIYDY